MHATKFIRHENYDPYTINNDIAVIKLPSPVKLNGKFAINFDFNHINLTKIILIRR